MQTYLVHYQGKNGLWTYMKVEANSAKDARDVAVQCVFVAVVGKVLAYPSLDPCGGILSLAV